MNASCVITKAYFCRIFKNNRIRPKLTAKIARDINILTSYIQYFLLTIVIALSQTGRSLEDLV